MTLATKVTNHHDVLARLTVVNHWASWCTTRFDALGQQRSNFDDRIVGLVEERDEVHFIAELRITLTTTFLHRNCLVFASRVHFGFNLNDFVGCSNGLTTTLIISREQFPLFIF